MTCDICIPFGTSSRHDNIELRYALRSVEMHMQEVGEVYIIGECPAWITNVNHIPYREARGSQNKSWNIYQKLLKACDVCSNQFIHMHDDHYLLQPVRASEFPYHHKGLLNTEGRSNEAYRHVLSNTMKLLPCCNSFNVHGPIRYERSKFQRLPSAWPEYGYLIKTLYCVTNGIVGEYYPDCKIGKATAGAIRDQIQNRLYFSMGDDAFNGDILKVFEELYPLPSKYEL